MVNTGITAKQRYQRARRAATTLEMKLRRALRKWHDNPRLRDLGSILQHAQHFCNARELAAEARVRLEQGPNCNCERCPCCGRVRRGPEGACPECGYPYGRL